MATGLVDADVNVVYAAVDLGTIADRSGLRIRPAAVIDELDPARADALIVPGGDPEAIIDDPEVTGLLRAAHEAGSVVAGICAGVVVTASAGLLHGRSITHNYRSPWAPPDVSAFR